MIGNQNYTNIKPLETPIADAKAVAEVLEKQYGFTVELLLDATDKHILTAVSNLRKTMTKEDDSLLIYYAGHGFLDKQSGVDYWQPVNAARDNDVDWVPTSRITDMLKVIQARHVLIVADSCYSGSLLTRDSGAKLASGMEQDEWLRRMYQKRSRTAMTSGGEEPVADGGGSGHSVFAKAFLDALRENQKILDGDGLYDKIKRPVALNADQTPQYSDIRKSGHEMGDFLLVPKELHETELQKQPERGTDLSFLQRSDGDKNLQPITMEGKTVVEKGKIPEKVVVEEVAIPKEVVEEVIKKLESGNADQPESKTIGQYIDHGNGTITDTVSKLMWKRCSEGLSGVNCKEGKTETYTWDDAVKRFKNAEYAGYSDWRLSTIDELKTLVQCSKGMKDKNSGRCNDWSERPTINQQAFANTKATVYWSGSPYADGAWYVSFLYGHSRICNRSSTYAVRLVRGGQ
uniref:Lcl domain-containing protein n=1 Tax=Candidatus Electronema sp. TaxID=2698783 RepID=UPI004056231C